jgi:hypothetical protein
MLKSNVTIDPHSGYEKRDVSLPTLTKWVIFLFIFVIVCSAIAWVVYVMFLPRGRDPLALAPLTPGQRRPPSPVVQAYPRVEMRQFRAQENAAVASYGWANKERGEVRIPVGRALEMLAERGLPTGQVPVSKSDPGLRPGNRTIESGSATGAGETTQPGQAQPVHSTGSASQHSPEAPPSGAAGTGH